ncbi:MAG TPA: hypothetical protein VF556_00930 [Pyrinomonadaceae bacterium]|jgi:hypothetical protein
MRKFKELSILLLESVSYGFLGTLFVSCVLLIEDFYTRISIMPGFSLDYGERGIPPGGVLIGATISVVFWNLLFGRIIKSALIRWSLILVTSSISALLIQVTALIYLDDNAIDQLIAVYAFGGVLELLGVSLMIKLFIILTPFTILFASCHWLIRKIQKRNALK